MSPKKKPLPTERGKNPNKRSPMGSGRLVEDVLHICLHWRGHIGCQFLRHPGEMPGLFGERLHLFARVFPPNATEIIKQWTDVHGLPAWPSFEAIVDGYPRQVWVNAAGDELIELYTIPSMAHGTPLATGAADNQCGAAGPFLLEVGISSSYHITKFFGLAAKRMAPEFLLRPLGAACRKCRVRELAQKTSEEALEGEVLEPNFGQARSTPLSISVRSSQTH